MSRFSEIAQIYDHRLPLLRSPEIWEQTLRMTSSFWRLNFCEAMLLTLQNPKAEMCGTIDQWNNIGRYIRRGEHSTAVFRSRADTQLMYLFDVRQTYGKAYNSKWKLSERMADGIVGKFNSENAENAVSFEDYLQKSLDKNIDIVYNYNRKLNNAISNDPRTAAFIRASAEFICMTRCGIPGDSDFSDVAKINSDLSIVEIGNAATALAQAVLREIDGIIRRKEYERYEAGIYGRHLRYPVRGRSERTVPPEIHELWQGADDSAGAQSGGPDERNRPDGAGYGEHQRAVPPDMERDREESGESPEQHGALPAGENLPQPGLLSEREPADGDRHGGAGSGLGISEDERIVAGGGSPEPGESVGDPENLDEPDDEELDEMVSDDESDTISVFTDIPEEISPDSDYAKKLLEDEIIHGSGFSNGKFRISEYVSENSPNKDELAKFLKNEYGIGGSSRNDDPVSFSNHDGKGIELVLSNKQVIRFNWKKVAEAVRSAVNNGTYITESDIELRRRMTLFDAQRFAIHYEYPHCLYNDRLDYIRKEIAVCGLDYPIRLNADMFAVYAAECVRTKQHVKESYQKIDRSSINIPWKFNDWNEAAEAGKNLPIDSGYGQFRAMCRDSVSELMNEISAHTGHNPVLGFPEEEITEFFASGEPLTSDSVDKITSEVFGYLYNQEQHSRLNSGKPTKITAPEQPAEQFTLFGDNEFTMEEPQADELPDESLNRAAAYIKDYFEQEFGSAAEIEDPSHVDLAYTTDEENDAVISVYADLVQYRITTEYGGNIAREEQYNSLDEMNELALKFLSFDDLISLSDEEKGLEVRHGVAVEENEPEVRHGVAPKIETADRAYAAQKPTPPENYRFPDNFAYPTGPKAKYTANVTAIKTLKQIESEHRHATAEEQDILAHYSGWGGIADAFDSTKEKWSREYAELKDLLTDKEYTAARESTLTAFYTEPYIIKSIYTALENMGFTGGEILDPAMGTGNFFGNLPAKMAENSRLYGVELDSLTARIAKELYPEAKIQNRGFERTKFENGTFDVIIGNVPFGDFKPYDPEYDEYLIHDYFFAKSIDKLKPGGIMALITSAGTMDKYDDSFRRELSRKADFLGGVRLPEDAFRTAGTQTVTDILFFQKLEFEHENDRNLDWVRSERVYGEASVFQENRYFRQNPEMVLGTPEIVSGRFGNTRTIKSDGNTAERLSEAIGRLDGHFSAEPTIDDELPKEEYGDIPDGVTPYTYYVSGGSLYYAENRSAVPFTGSSEPRIKAMCGILDRLNEVTAAQKKGCSDDELKALQSRLNNAYDGFVKKYGHLNSRTNISAFADDIRAPRLTSIENVEELPDGKQRFTKADIFTERTINVDRVPAHVDTALEALHLSINLKQTVDLEYISQLCGKDKDAVISELGEHIYCNPAKNTGGRYSGWETAEEYLSGHVRSKLALAQEAAKTDPDYERNVAALLDNQPPRIGIEDIGFRVGTIYIEPEMFQDFVYETFQTPEWQRHRPNMHGYSKEITVNYSPEMNQWKVTNSSGMSDVLSTETYGTKRLNAYELTELLLNQKRAVVNDYRELPDGRTERVFNAKETILARECQDKIEQAFHDWVMADKDRIQIIEDRFNALFNNIKPRTYNGDYITIPGMNPNLTLRPHQKNVIARIAATGTCMMAHEVGAGKTAAMGAAGMYLKSIGACTKPMYVVPNAVVAQFGEELQRFFPEAKILVATSKDMEKSQRRRFLSKISVGNFDAIVIPQSQFEKMPLSLERQEAMYDEKLTEISSAIQAAKADKGERFTVKALERQRKQIEKKIEKMRAAFKKDDFITFEELGCDFLFVDEAHNYKNLAVFSKMNNVAGVNANANSQKAFDMEMKCRYLQELHNGGGVVFATGTPISNSITELFVWQYLLQKQTLDDMNIGYFDNWASVFGVITQSIEVKPSGDGFRPRTRFSNFVNLNELCNLFGEVFDIAKTADMNLKLPAIQNGKPEMIICEKSPEQELQTDEGIERARRIEAKMVQPDEDNMLAVCTYMTKVALDARIIDPEAEEYDGGKVALCAEKIIEINKANPGTAQAVFCDTNTPKKDAFSVYQALRDRLVRSGEFTENEIAFVHDAANDKQRLAMFEKVNNAEIKIIIGSTGKLGTGVNIQRKLSALHHLDAPYRPSDIEQRNGRGIRQGNENSEVYIGYYSTKGTFDNYRWQILEKKQQIISQIMSGKPAARTCEDIDDTALTFAEMKAATTGNPLIAEKMTVDNEVNRLKLLQANYYQQQRSFEYDISNRYPDLISRKEKMIEWTKKDIELISAAPPIKEDNFRMTLGGMTYVERSKAGDELAALVTKYMMSDDYQEYKSRAVGELNDFKIMLLHKGALVSLSLKANGHYTCDYSMSGLGGVTRLCNLYERIPEQIHGLAAELEQAKKQLANAKEQYGKPFQYEEQLRAGLERQAEINAELEVADKPHDEAVMGDCSDDEGEEMEM